VGLDNPVKFDGSLCRYGEAVSSSLGGSKDSEVSRVEVRRLYYYHQQEYLQLFA
jgi:hypothetical protein